MKNGLGCWGGLGGDEAVKKQTIKEEIRCRPQLQERSKANKYELANYTNMKQTRTKPDKCKNKAKHF